MIKRAFLRIGLGVVCGAALLGLCFFFTSTHEDCQYSLINPTRCDEEGRFSNPEYDTTRLAVESFLQKQKSAGLGEASVSFRDLRNGPSFLVDSGTGYYAMSLFKLPILFRFLKDAENDPNLLNHVITVKIPESAVNQNFPMNETLVNGEDYSIRDILRRMIIYSDNNSRTALLSYYEEKHPGTELILSTLEELGIVDSKNFDDQRLISLRSVSSLFRILYNSSYLRQDMSQLALDWMTESTYDTGLAKPIPQSIAVANKFGLLNTAELKQLHDCGIIYYPDHPYSLCIMTSGSSLEVLEQTISSISDIVYTEVNRRFGE